MARKILVLGGSGFVGRHVVRRLAVEGFVPVAASRSPKPMAGVATLRLNATDASSLRAALVGVEGIVNCVSGTPSSIVAGANVLRQVLDEGVHPTVRLVHFSSMAAYGLVTGRISETQTLAGDAGPYSQAKADAEAALAQLPGAVMLRPGCIYGPGSEQWTMRVAALLRARRLGDLGAAGDGHSNLVYIDDVVEAVVRALRCDELGGRAFNLAMRDAPRWNEYFVALARALGAVPVQRIPGWQIKLERKLIGPALKVVELTSRRLGLRIALPIITPSMLNLWQRDIELSADQAELGLGLQWTSLHDGILASVGEVS